jgi:acetate kinase
LRREENESNRIVGGMGGLVVTINAGSSSVRLGAFRAAAGGSGLEKVAGRRENTTERRREFLEEFLADGRIGRPSAVAHRVVHGGPNLRRSCRVGPSEEAEIRRLTELAPLHQPPALEWIEAARETLGDGVPQIAAFDTSFFAGLPGAASRYALPAEWSRREEVRRYGFHGLAHRAMWERWIELHPGTAHGGRVITLQLGSGCSAAAIEDGRPLDTSMGFSPLEGLAMATRSGDVDPELVLHLQKALGLSPDQMREALNRRSGLLGMSGTSADVRDLLADARREAGEAVDLYVHRIRKTIGAYLAVLGGCNGIVFGGGVGEHVPEIRKRAIEGMEWCGVSIDENVNRRTMGSEGRISKPAKGVEVWVVPVDEAAILAREAFAVLAEGAET